MSAKDCVNLLKEKRIKVCVFDMDLTAVAAHSRGSLRRDKLEEYLDKATPDFLELVPLVHDADIGLSIATQSDEAEYHAHVQPATHILGTALVRSLVSKHFHPDIAQSFFIVAYNPRIRQVTEERDLIKRFHMRQIIEHFGVQPQEIVFFDDILKTVEDCKFYCRVRAVQVDEKVGFQFSDLLNNLS